MDRCLLGQYKQRVFQPRRWDQENFCEGWCVCWEGCDMTADLPPQKGAELLVTTSRGHPTPSSEVDSAGCPLLAGQKSPDCPCTDHPLASQLAHLLSLPGPDVHAFI